jgi:tetratricopeptide (TPR) repeat protein
LIESPGREDERLTALVRVLRHYRILSSDAVRWISSTDTSGHTHESSFATQKQAFAFLDVEKGTLIECVRVARRYGFFEAAWRIGISLDPYLNVCRDLIAATEVLELACNAAGRIAPVNNEMLSEAHNRLGWALREMGHYAQASENHRLAVQYAEAGGLRHDQCVALEYLGVSLWHERKIEDALAAYRRTIELTDGKPELSNIHTMAINDSGLCYRSAGRFDEAIKAHQDALRIYHRLEVDTGVAVALCNVGRAQIAAGRPGLALSPLKESITIYEGLGRAQYHEKALAILALGRALRDDGQRAAAREALEDALQLFGLNNDLRHQAATYRELARNERSGRRARSAYTASLALYQQLGATAATAEVGREKASRSGRSQLHSLLGRLR